MRFSYLYKLVILSLHTFNVCPVLQNGCVSESTAHLQKSPSLLCACTRVYCSLHARPICTFCTVNEKQMSFRCDTRNTSREITTSCYGMYLTRVRFVICVTCAMRRSVISALCMLTIIMQINVHDVFWYKLLNAGLSLLDEVLCSIRVHL